MSSTFKDTLNACLNKKLYEEEEEGQEELASKKTDKCPVCGKTGCSCQCSRSTETGGGDDDDDGYQAAVKTEKNFLAGDITPEEKEMLALFRRAKGKLAGSTTPEEEKMLALFRKEKDKFQAAVKTAFPGEFEEVKQNKGASEDSPDLKDDHTNGRNGSCKTESLFNY